MNIPFVPADSSNFYSGRGGNSIKYIVMHYTANDGDTDEGNASCAKPGLMGDILD